MRKQPSPTYFLPQNMLVPVREQMDFWANVQEQRGYPGVSLVAFPPGMPFALGPKKRITSFKTFHRVPSQGYLVEESRTKLKKKYANATMLELITLKNQGVEIQDTFWHPLFAVSGDTTTRLFSGDVSALEADTVFLECTFLWDVQEKEAALKGHMRIADLEDNADKLQSCKHLVLYHFSNRYKNADIEQAIQKLPRSLREKTAFLPIDKERAYTTLQL